MTERPLPIQRGIRQEALGDTTGNITLDSIYKNNISAEAQLYLDEWNEARRSGHLIGVAKCADARGKTPGRETLSVSNIAAAKSPTLPLALDRGNRGWVSLTHFDGETAIPGRMPTGCGGLAAKAEIGDTSHKDGTKKYVSELIDSPDPIIQSLRTAERIADLSRKPTVALSFDHRTHDIYVHGIFQTTFSGAISRVSAVREYDIQHYDPKKLYANGIPTIDESYLPDFIQEMLEENRIDNRRTLELYPDFYNMQKVQDPRLIWVTTSVQSLRRIPTFSSIPGAIFKVHAERETIDDVKQISGPAMERVMEQVTYALQYAAGNADEKGKQFSSTDTIVAEAPSMQQAINLANRIRREQDAKDWLTKPGRKIIALQTLGGRIVDGQEITA